MNIKRFFVVLLSIAVLAIAGFIYLPYSILSSIEEKHKEREQNEPTKQELTELNVEIGGEMRYNLKSLAITQVPTAFHVEPGARLRYEPETSADSDKTVFVKTTKDGAPIDITKRYVKKTITGDTVWFLTDSVANYQTIDVYYLKD